MPKVYNTKYNTERKARRYLISQKLDIQFFDHNCGTNVIYPHDLVFRLQKIHNNDNSVNLNDVVRFLEDEHGYNNSYSDREWLRLLKRMPSTQKALGTLRKYGLACVRLKNPLGATVTIYNSRIQTKEYSNIQYNDAMDLLRVKCGYRFTSCLDDVLELHRELNTIPKLQSKLHNIGMHLVYNVERNLVYYLYNRATRWKRRTHRLVRLLESVYGAVAVFTHKPFSEIVEITHASINV